MNLNLLDHVYLKTTYLATKKQPFGCFSKEAPLIRPERASVLTLFGQKKRARHYLNAVGKYFVNPGGVWLSDSQDVLLVPKQNLESNLGWQHPDRRSADTRYKAKIFFFFFLADLLGEDE